MKTKRRGKGRVMVYESGVEACASVYTVTGGGRGGVT